MAERPYVSFAEVKERVSIVEALEALGIAHNFQRKGNRLTGCCPLKDHRHGPRPNSQQFKVDCKQNLFYCHGDCKRGGDVIELVKGVTGFDDCHVRFFFADHWPDRLTLRKPNGQSRVEKDTAREDLGQEDHSQAAPYAPSNLPEPTPALKPLRFHLNLDPDVPYLRERGVGEETIRRYGLGRCDKGVLKGYVAIPVFRWPRDEGEKPVAYLGRWPGADEGEKCPRYKWPEGFPKSHVVYAMAEALAGADDEPLIVVEGPFKVYHLYQAGFANTVALFGSSLSDEQAALLVSTRRRIILMFDGDEAGRQGMRAAAGKLITSTYVRVVKLADGCEPDDLAREELVKLLQ